MSIETIEITSKENSTYKELKRLSRRKSEYIFIEGKKLFIETVNSPLIIEKVYIDKKNQPNFSKLLPLVKSDKLVFVKEELISSLFTTDSKPTGSDIMLALAKRPDYQINELFKSKSNLVFLERIQDPGNLGTILRSALAFNAGGVLLSVGSADPFNPKVIRASAGAIFKLPIVTVNDLKEFNSLIKKEKYKIVATLPVAKKKLSEMSLNSKIVFLFGNEGSGLSKELLSIANETVRIPHLKAVESLNVGVAVSLVLWEIYKENG